MIQKWVFTSKQDKTIAKCGAYGVVKGIAQIA
jgi:hypothetical protein